MTDIFQMALDRNEIMTDMDGFYKYWPITNRVGCLTAENLRAIADGLDKMNEPWQKQLDEYFDQLDKLEQTTEEPQNDSI